jgi:RNA polymerase sigma factor (sigma-70 family)
MVDVVARASSGDASAWDLIVDEYIGLVWSIARGFGLGEADCADAVQTTWLRLVEHLDRIQDPCRVGAWLATTTRRECLRLVAYAKRVAPARDEEVFERPDISLRELDARLLDAEQSLQMNIALAQLPPRWRELLLLLVADPAPSYEEISQQLMMPIGSIGPTRGRALRRLRALLDGEVSTAVLPAS